MLPTFALLFLFSIRYPLSGPLGERALEFGPELGFVKAKAGSRSALLRFAPAIHKLVGVLRVCGEGLLPMECAGKRSATALWLLRGDARACAAPLGLGSRSARSESGPYLRGRHRAALHLT